MQTLKQNRGFTLVEIIVSIAIFSIVLAILGSVMVNGFKYFYQTSSTDLDKRSIDELANYVRNELIYATDVQITDTSPGENWYSFSVVDGKLHHYDQDNHDLNILNNNEFYNYHKFKMTAKAYENKNRLDLIFTMYDNENLYTTKDTLELLNIESIVVAPFAQENIIGDTDLRIYYKKDKKRVNQDINGKLTGTVADRLIDLISYSNSRGYYKKEYHYNKGDYVYFNDYWWYKNGGSANDDRAPNSPNGGWTKLTQEYPLGEYSWYYPGDIVIFNGRYLMCHNRWNSTSGSTHSFYYPLINTEVGQYDNYDWVEISKEEAQQKEYSNFYTNDITTITDKLPDSLKVTDTARNSIPEYRDSQKYVVGDYVRVREINTNYYHVYLKIFNGNGSPGSSNLSGWQLLQNDYDAKSSYVKGDMVIGFLGNIANTTSGNRFKYFKCIRDVLTENSYQEYVNEVKDYTMDIKSLSQNVEIIGETSLGWITKFFYEESIN